MWVLISFVSFLVFVIQHEETHKAISENHGCINGTITYIAIEPYFMCHEYSSTANKDTFKEEMRMHTLNEIVGYNVESILSMLFAIGVLGIMLADYMKDE